MMNQQTITSQGWISPNLNYSWVQKTTIFRSWVFRTIFLLVTRLQTFDTQIFFFDLFPRNFFLFRTLIPHSHSKTSMKVVVSSCNTDFLNGQFSYKMYKLPFSLAPLHPPSTKQTGLCLRPQRHGLLKLFNEPPGHAQTLDQNSLPKVIHILCENSLRALILLLSNSNPTKAPTKTKRVALQISLYILTPLEPPNPRVLPPSNWSWFPNSIFSKT